MWLDASEFRKWNNDTRAGLEETLKDFPKAARFFKFWKVANPFQFRHYGIRDVIEDRTFVCVIVGSIALSPQYKRRLLDQAENRFFLIEPALEERS